MPSSTRVYSLPVLSCRQGNLISIKHEDDFTTSTLPIRHRIFFDRDHYGHWTRTIKSVLFTKIDAGRPLRWSNNSLATSVGKLSGLRLYAPKTAASRWVLLHLLCYIFLAQSHPASEKDRALGTSPAMDQTSELSTRARKNCLHLCTSDNQSFLISCA
jgi:hypothetical protein